MSVIPTDDMSAHSPSSAMKTGRNILSRRLGNWLPRLLVALGLLLAAGIALSFAGFVRSIARFEPHRVDPAAGIVVLTGGSQRLTDALGLLASGHGRRLLISGVHQKTSRDEIARIAGYRGDKLECCADLGKSARNTIGNAIEARRWARENGFRSLIVVTSNYHMPRTLGEFAHVMGDIEVVGYPVVSDSVDMTRLWADPGALRLIASEYVKYVISRARRSIEGDPEHSRLPTLVGRQKPVGPQAIERADTLEAR